MSYRSIKRYLGENNLERKCLFLFGTCLLLLIGASFWWVEINAERLVLNTTRSNGRDLVDTIMLKTHFERWETGGDRKQVVRRLIEDLEHQEQDYSYEILSNDRAVISSITSRPLADSSERDIFKTLVAKMAQQEEQKRLAEQEQSPRPPTGGEPLTTQDLIEPTHLELPPVFADRPFPDQDEYHYFEPVYWARNCRACHSDQQNVAGELPMLVIKVVIPYKPTQDLIARNRAILFAAAIITVALAMGGLYLIVRYVIVKPLQHLREVSDEISHGNMTMRAEIHTNDEFEELAASFNKMLQHLTDAQQEMRDLNVDLDARLDELAQLNVRLYEMNRLKGDFLANMSHELRTPLNSIIGFSDVLQGIDSLNEKQKRYARNIQKSGRLLLDMINDILDLAKMEAGRLEVRLSEFRIDSVIHAQCDMVRAQAEEKNIDLEVNIQPETPALFQDQVKVQQILTNLLSNAVKFTPEGGRITVSAHMAKNGMLHLSVADTGVGIPEEDREIIFEKFRQSKTVLGEDGLTREYSGTGLGLSIVKEMCKLLGGEVTFDSELGKGSTFMVKLPWTCHSQARRDTHLDNKMHELTRPKRVDFHRAESEAAPDGEVRPTPEPRNV
ncbi:sensor histidine kinase [Lignipirellula cremea]|uniref:histidine kinase n=1 Tax=Lignipirellula cremea TaxID=2528010 RepID=A0A518DLI3_9BACT|nr:HAMP domain-containing sensor histidine kinase [Lignipirellula cremea]QDU92686.1 Histidine protein kinase DivJ [Lignipirellula cremea]